MKLFTKTWVNDFPWMKLALKSVARNYTGLKVEWGIVLDDGTRGDFQKVVDQVKQELEGKPGPVMDINVVEASQLWSDGVQKISQPYLRQQWIKMTANRLMGPGLFWNWDSDVIAIKPFDAKTFCNHDGKPIYWFSQLNHLIVTGGGDKAAHDGRRALTKIATNYEPSFEWMRCMPVPLIGQVLEHASGQGDWQRAFAIMASNDHRFSEFNVIGQFCHLYYPDAFDWRNAENNGPTWSSGYVEGGVGSGCFQAHATICQAWSWGGVPPHIADYVNNL